VVRDAAYPPERNTVSASSLQFPARPLYSPSLSVSHAHGAHGRPWSLCLSPSEHGLGINKFTFSKWAQGGSARARGPRGQAGPCRPPCMHSFDVHTSGAVRIPCLGASPAGSQTQFGAHGNVARWPRGFLGVGGMRWIRGQMCRARVRARRELMRMGSAGREERVSWCAPMARVLGRSFY